MDTITTDVEKLSLELESVKIKQNTQEVLFAKIDTKQEMMLKMLTDINAKIR